VKTFEVSTGAAWTAGWELLAADPSGGKGGQHVDTRNLLSLTVRAGWQVDKSKREKRDGEAEQGHVNSL